MATVQYKTATCDECNHKFKLKPKIMKVKKIGKSVERSYFLCPKCKHEYVVMYQDQETKDNLKRMEGIKVQASKLKINDKDYISLMSEYDTLYKRNLEISKEYKKLYGS
jgi:DNA replicative helicase MCM subunit Mcm2 (Cdc46/Mcm family)